MSWSRDYVRVLNRLLYACTFLFPPIHLDFHCIQIASLMNVLLPSGAQGKWMKRKGSASTRGVVSCVAEASETFFFSREVRNLLYDLPSRESRVFSISCFFFVILFYFSHFKRKCLSNCTYPQPRTDATGLSRMIISSEFIRLASECKRYIFRRLRSFSFLFFL